MIVHLVKEVANRLKNPDLVKEFAQFRGNFLSLSYGYPGLLILMATLDNLYPWEGWDEAAHLYVLKIKEAIEAGQTDGISLFKGLAGSCFAIEYASKKKTRYQKLTNTLRSYLFQNISPFYLTALQEKVDLSLPCFPSLYDLTSGISGIGIYLLNNLDCASFASCLKDIVRVCVALARDIKVGSYTVPGWYMPSHYQLSEQDQREYKKGNFNLGIAHGISGILGFLSIAALKGVIEEGQIEAMQKISDWLCSKKKLQNGIFVWPNRISFEEEILGRKDEIFTMNAWCYGTPGIARILYLASRVLKNSGLEQIACDCFLGVLNEPEIFESTITPSFCHGFSGLLTLTHLMARDTNLSEFWRLRGKLENKLLASYREETVFGFKDVELNLTDTTLLNLPLNSPHSTLHLVEIDRAGMLEGVSGILLSLLTNQMESLPWATPFLIEENFI